MRHIDKDNIEDIQWEDVYSWDAPDFVDAYISYATINGEPLTNEELEEIMKDTSWVFEKLYEHLY